MAPNSTNNRQLWSINSIFPEIDLTSNICLIKHWKFKIVWFFFFFWKGRITYVFSFLTTNNFLAIIFINESVMCTILNYVHELLCSLLSFFPLHAVFIKNWQSNQDIKNLLSKWSVFHSCATANGLHFDFIWYTNPPVQLNSLHRRPCACPLYKSGLSAWCH